jgi:Fe-S-cluster containining protein
LAELLIVVRSPDPPGAFSAISEDAVLIAALAEWPGDDVEKSWEALVDRVFELGQAQRCLRCGTCCRKSSPTLYRDDLEAIEAGRIKRQSLFTLRAGELVHSTRLDKRFVLEQDLIKLRERPQGGCLKLDDHLCSAYDDRPLQCRHLECWSGRDAGDLEDRPRLNRRDLYRDDPQALALIEEFDIKVPATGLTEALVAAKVGDDEASSVALELIDLDHRLRLAIEQRYDYSLGEQELLFGRDGVELVKGHGLMIRIDESDRPTLVKR